MIVEKKIKFSIGIPVYKGYFLKECIDSILAQSYNDFELIIVNDCSPDNIKYIVSHYNDSRLRYYENDINIGAENVIDNWNKCLSYSNGEFFILMGDDDKMEVNYLSEFSNLISNYPDLDVYHCRVKIINENSDLIRLTPICSVYENTSKYILNCLQGRYEQFISDFVYRKINLVNNGGFFKLPLAWASDYTTSYIACGNKGIAYTPIPILCYRQNQFNITSTGSFELKRLAIIGYDNWLSSYLNQLNNNDPSLYILKKSFYKIFKSHKITFIQMMIGRSWKSIFICIKKRNKFKISLTNIFEAVFISLIKKFYFYK